MFIVIKFIVIVFDEKTYLVKFSVLYYLILNFTTLVIAFVDNVMNFCISKSHIFIYQILLAKADENLRGKVKGQRGRIPKVMASL